MRAIRQAQERIVNYERAVQSYQRYLRDRVDPPDRRAIESHIAELERQMEEIRQANVSAPTSGTLQIRVNHEGADVQVDEPGELWLRGPNIFTGYWGNAQATGDAFAPGGWFKTGDVGYRTESGFVYISDRIKDVVISGGENIYPAEIEPALAEHPAIAEVAVIGRSDDRWGEIPVAVVVLADGAELELADLREWCDGRLARFKHPRGLRIVPALPRTALGKVKKHELRVD